MKFKKVIKTNSKILHQQCVNIILNMKKKILVIINAKLKSLF